jgi:hypothetical protein
MRKIIVFIALATALVIGVKGQEPVAVTKFGFSIQPPKGWITANKDVRNENVRRLEMSDDALKKLLESDKGTTSLLSYFRQDPNTTAGLVPVVNVDVRRMAPVPYQQFKADLTKSADGLKTYFPDIKFGAPADVEIGGIRSVLFTSTFTMKTADGQILQVRNRVYGIPMGNYFFQISLNDGPEKELDCTHEFDQVIKSIKIGG